MIEFKKYSNEMGFYFNDKRDLYCEHDEEILMNMSLEEIMNDSFDTDT